MIKTKTKSDRHKIWLQKIFIKESDIFTLSFSLGGLLISIGGILLALLTTDSPPLSQQQIFDILPFLLLIVGIFFLIGIVYPKKWQVKFPFLN